MSAAVERFRLRHRLPAARWPTAEEAARSRWFSPARIGDLDVAERTWVPAMVPWRATGDGHVTRDVLDWYARFAAGQPGVLVVEATGIRDVPSGPLLRIGSDRFLPGLARLVETVRERSEGRTRLFIQVIDFLAVRRRPEPATYFARHLAIGDELRRRLAVALGERSVVAALQEHADLVGLSRQEAPSEIETRALRERDLDQPGQSRVFVVERSPLDVGAHIRKFTRARPRPCLRFRAGFAVARRNRPAARLR